MRNKKSNVSKENTNKEDTKKKQKKSENLSERDIEELMSNRSYKRVNGSIRQTRYRKGDNRNG